MKTEINRLENNSASPLLPEVATQLSQETQISQAIDQSQPRGRGRFVLPTFVTALAVSLLLTTGCDAFAHRPLPGEATATPANVGGPVENPNATPPRLVINTPVPVKPTEPSIPATATVEPTKVPPTPTVRPPEATPTQPAKIEATPTIPQLVDLILQDANALSKPPEASDEIWKSRKQNVEEWAKDVNKALASNDTATAIEKGKKLKDAIQNLGSIKLIVNIPQEIKLAHDPKGKYLEKYADADPSTLKPFLETVDLLVSLDKKAGTY